MATKKTPKTLSSQSTLGRRQRVQSAETGMEILKALGSLGGAASLTAVSHAVEESTAKVHRYMASLLSAGLVAQNSSTQHYHLGHAALQIGLAALRQCDPIRLGEASLIRLRESLEVTCFIAVMGNKGPTVLRIEEPTLPVTVNIRLGSVLPVLWSAAGQAFLTHSNDPQVFSQAQAEFKNASAERKALLASVDPINQLRRQVIDHGCSIVHDMLLQGISAVGAPIFDSTGKVCAVLVALGASSGFDTRPRGRVCPEVIREASAISSAMGFEMDPAQS